MNLDVTDESLMRYAYLVIARNEMNIRNRRLILDIFRDTFDAVSILSKLSDDQIMDKIRTHIEHGFIQHQMRHHTKAKVRVIWSVDTWLVYGAMLETFVGRASLNYEKGVVEFNDGTETREIMSCPPYATK